MTAPSHGGEARRGRRLLKDERGSVFLEFAFTLPVLLILFFGCLEAAQLVRVYMKLGLAARDMADLVAQQALVTPAVMADVCEAGELVMTPWPAGDFSAAAASVSDPAGTVGVDWQDASCGGGAAISNPAGLLSGVVSSAGDSAIVVEASYAYKPITSWVLSASFSLTSVAYAHPRNSQSVPHS